MHNRHRSKCFVGAQLFERTFGCPFSPAVSGTAISFGQAKTDAQAFESPT
ncbi:two component transcriptional regulator, winged helix family [Alicyclobacillus hesperidum URH17-3-68]|nr:two component transcriptional regulator, winged helix family [Alicyclobacillus hesperidum URH17-3-68]